ncbi:MAG TPA: rod shape-determining protein MreC, partial [Candidatus Angelobacter sp.]|nr:rod shape-determining protein MreC [Candidatus Angelobacter sp.]
MENFFSRYKNPLVLMAILFVQVVALATQVKRPEGGTGSAASGGTRLIRVWTVTAISPFERALVASGSFVRRNFHNYIDLHDARQQNRQLQDEIAQLKLEQVRLRQDAEQAKRLRSLLGFTQRYVGQLLPAQVIGTSGTEQSHMIQIDKGSSSGVKVDMPVITPDGIVGKVKDVFPFTSLVLLINDRDSGAGVILQTSRLQGVLRGNPQGELHVGDIMSDEKIDDGEEVITSGGDRIYPKGLPVGTVSHVSPDHDNEPFLAVKVKPAADLSRLEEVLVVTKVAQETPQQSGQAANVRAADILSERLPSVPKPEETKKAGAAKTTAPVVSSPTPSAPETSGTKPAANPSAPPAALKTATSGSTTKTGSAPKPVMKTEQKAAQPPRSSAASQKTAPPTGTSPANAGSAGTNPKPKASPTPLKKPKAP